MATDDMTYSVTLLPLATGDLQESLPPTTPLPSSGRGSPSESSTTGAVPTATASVDSPSSREKHSPASSISSRPNVIKPTNVTTEDHPIENAEGKGEGTGKQGVVETSQTGTGAQEVEYARLQAQKKEQEKTDEWVRNFDGAQQGGRSLSILDPEWADLHARFQEDTDRRERYLREHAEAVPERKRRRDFVRRLLSKLA